MFCPNCGASDQKPDAYCRRCGLWLVDMKAGKRRKSGSPSDQMNAMMTFNALSALMALASTIALYSTYLGQPDAKWSIYMAGAFCTVIAVHQTVSFCFALRLRQRFKKGLKGAPEAIESRGADRLMVSGDPEPLRLENAASITENTTELLEEAPAKSGPGIAQEERFN